MTARYFKQFVVRSRIDPTNDALAGNGLLLDCFFAGIRELGYDAVARATRRLTLLARADEVIE